MHCLTGVTNAAFHALRSKSLRWLRLYRNTAFRLTSRSSAEMNPPVSLNHYSQLVTPRSSFLRLVRLAASMLRWPVQLRYIHTRFKMAHNYRLMATSSSVNQKSSDNKKCTVAAKSGRFHMDSHLSPPSDFRRSGIKSYLYSGASRYSYLYSNGLTMTQPIFDHDRLNERFIGLCRC